MTNKINEGAGMNDKLIYAHCGEYSASKGIEPLKPETYDSEGNGHHYQGEIECIEAMRACSTPDEFRGYLRLTAMKYMWRYDKKKGGNRKQDAIKAQWFLTKLREFS